MPETDPALTALADLADLAPGNRVRVETALSRFPIHRLCKRGTISIDLPGDADFKWKVSYNNEYGQPGPLAYKVDTLIVNRCIDEAPRPLPEVIRLGSLREINRILGSAENDTETLKRALLQNASAFISAKIRFKPRNAKEGQEKSREIHYSRYSVVFGGDTLPNGTQADAVYIILNPPHRKLLNDAEVRPLDYDYLTQLAPGPQRLYELLSFQIYGAIAGTRPRAKLLYSEYCMCAPQMRYLTFEAVKKQMFKLHMPHRASGYILKVEYQRTTDGEGKADWEMLYTPGPRAFAEYQSFTHRQTRPLLQLPAPAMPATEAEPQLMQATPDLLPAQSTLLAELARRGITEKKARHLLESVKPGQEIADQLEYLDYLVAKAPRGKYHNPAGFYVRFIEDNGPIPDSFPTTRKRLLYEEARQSTDAQRARQMERELAYDEYCERETERFIEAMSHEEYQQLFNEQRRFNRSAYKRMTPMQVDELTHSTVRTHLKKSGRIPFLSLEEFSSQLDQ
ncbi:MAG TPA: hypothetical protein VMA31_10555 [Bryobacteraceae bacterium]|nr:hypothetical protein [Bryobacteraceae bacterium]